MNQKTPPVTIDKKNKVFHMTQNGLARIVDEEGKFIDLPFCLPGETAHYIEVQRRKRNDYYYRGFENASQERVPAICPHFTRCGGCLLQHMNTTTYQEYKKGVISELFVNNGLDPFVIEDSVFLNIHDRRRANMDIVKKNGATILGFHGLKSHSIINVEKCPVLDPSIEKILSPLRDSLNNVLSDFQKAKIFVVKTDVGIDLSLEIQEVATLDDNQQKHLYDFAEKEGLCRFIFRYRKTKLVIFQKEEPFITIDGVTIKVDPWSFLQASKNADTTLINWVIEALPQKVINSVDLFCGRGTFTFPLSKVSSVLGVESDKSSISALNEANELATRPITTRVQDLFTDPLKSNEFYNVDVVVMDPPRAGAHAQALELSKSPVPLIIYVSCNPETFVEDAKILQKGGYTLEKVNLLDQFIYTPHMEVVGIFKKGVNAFN